MALTFNGKLLVLNGGEILLDNKPIALVFCGKFAELNGG